MNLITTVYRSMSIRNKLFISNLFIIVVSLVTLALFANTVSKKAIIEKAINNSSREIGLVANNLQTLISSVEDYSRILASDHRLQSQLYNQMIGSGVSPSNGSGALENLDMKKTISEVISNIVEPNTNIAAASVFSANRQMVDAGYANQESATGIWSDELYQMIHASNRPVWTSLVRLKFRYTSQDNVFAVAKSVIHKDAGLTIGTVALYVKETTLASIYQDKMNYKGAQFYILNRNRVIISSQNKADLYQNFSSATNIPLNKEEDASILQGHGREKVLISSHVFQHLQWTIVSVIPFDEITVENKRINQIIIVIGSLCLLFAFAVSFLLSHSVTKSIFSLLKTMKEARVGNLKVRSMYQSPDEIGYLSDGFNNLMDQIEVLMVKNYEDQKLKGEIEFKLLQSQVKPHFLYNTLETIISLIKLNLKSEAISATRDLANFYKISLSKGNDIISVREELQLTENYLEIQKLRYVEYMTFSMEIEESMLPYRIPKLTLQPIVENAIYHGLKMKREKGFLSIRGYEHPHYIVIEIYDNGVGMEKQKIEQLLREETADSGHIDFGVRNVHNRIRILYGEPYGVEINSEIGSFTRVSIRLPKHDQ